LDFGSFFDKDEKNIVTTFNINKKAFNENKISNDLIVVFGTVMTLLSLKLLIQSEKYSKKFRNFIFDLSDEKDYHSESVDLLDYSYAETIITRYYKISKEEDNFTENLLDILFSLTTKKASVKKMVDLLEFFNR